MLPAIFGENLFDEMLTTMMRPMHSMEKALYGKHGQSHHEDRRAGDRQLL